MPHPHDHAANIMLAIFLGATSWWVSFIDSYGLVMAHIVVPTLSAAVLIGQLYLMWRKRHPRD